jgi:hypothetical protein
MRVSLDGIKGRQMTDHQSAEEKWKRLPAKLRENRNSWLALLAEHSMEPHEAGGLGKWLNEWLWLIPLAEALRHEPVLYCWYPHLAHGSLALGREWGVYSDYAYCDAIDEDRFRISLVKPKASYRNTTEIELEVLFEGECSETIVFLKNLAEGKDHGLHE